MQKTKKEKASKPRYNMLQNSWYMIRLAWSVKERKVIVLSFLSACLAVISDLVNLYISPTILSALERNVTVSELIMTIAGFCGGLMLISAAKAYVNSNTMMGRVNVRREMIAMLNRKAATTSYPNVEDERFINLQGKAKDETNGNYQSTEAIWNTLTLLTQNILGFAIYVSLLTTVQPFMLLVILVTTIISYFVNHYVSGYGYRHREEEGELVNKLLYVNGRARDWTAAKDIRLFGMRSWLEELADKTMDAYIAFHKKAQGAYIWSKIMDLILAFLRNGIAYAYLIRLVLCGELSVARFLLLFSAVGGFTKWVLGILGDVNMLHRQSLGISIVRECLEYSEPFVFEGGETLEVSSHLKYEIRLEHVSFRYPGADKDILHDINLTLHPGEKLAIVGRNGAGKTTLVKLICGFYDPTEGRVLLNGMDIKKYNRADYYKMFSAVFQSFSILAGTIAMNVAQTEEDIDLERVKACVEKAGLRQKIESLPNGYDAHLNREVYEDAVMLSGGETQRLMLARALYKDAPMIILDEPTAALDPIAESDIYQKYSEMTKGKSSVYISHRLASTRFCDRIVLIDHASILEEGTHEELLLADGKYAELFAVQSKYYQEGEEYNEE